MLFEVAVLMGMVSLRVVFTLVAELFAASGASHRNSILRIVRPDRQVAREWGGFWVVLSVDAIFISLLIYCGGRGMWASGNVETWILAVLFFGQFASFDFLAYWGHRAQHSVPFFYKTHAEHHASVIPSPLTSFSNSALDRTLLVLCFFGPGLLLNLTVGEIPIWFTAVSLASTDAVSFLAHLNREITPSWYGSSFLSRVFNSPTGHALHHARQNGNYGFASPLMDRIFGTEYQDTDAVAEAARNGDGLKSLKERR